MYSRKAARLVQTTRAEKFKFYYLKFIFVLVKKQISNIKKFRHSEVKLPVVGKTEWYLGRGAKPQAHFPIGELGHFTGSRFRLFQNGNSTKISKPCRTDTVGNGLRQVRKVRAR
jgi:hypothetical protein